MNSRDLGIVALIILGVLVLVPVLGMSLGGGWGMMGPGMMGGRGPSTGLGPGMMGYGFGFGPLVLLVLIAGVVLLVLAVTRKEPKTDESLGILKARLAKGEITREQFEELKQVLQ